MFTDQRHLLKRVLTFAAIAGLAALILTFATPSEPKGKLIGAYSPARIALGGMILIGLIILLVLLREENKKKLFEKVIMPWILREDRIYFLFLSLQGLFFIFLWAFQFSWLFVPKNLRPVLIWGAASALYALAELRLCFRSRFESGHFREKYRLFPRLKDLSSTQKKTLIPLLAVSLIYIAVLMPSNINGSRGWEDFRHYGGDEYVMYPILEAVCDPGDNFSQALYHHYIYEDYHYGYPFYAWSSLVLLPYRLVYGTEALRHIELTLPTLRILVSVVPLMAACLVLTFLFTRFRRPLTASLTYVFLLTAPGSLQNNQGFWHPDGLNLLFVCLTIYFLQRDRSRYGRNFFLAAVFAGLSAATRLYGFFFFLAVGVCLISGLCRKILDLRSFLTRSLLFLLVMGGTILWSDPFLFRTDARQNMLNIMKEKTGEMSSGYNADFNDPKNDYRPGWDAWYPAFEDHYTEMFCFFFLLGSLIFACFCGPCQNEARVTALWWVVIAVYLIWFVAVKSTQYVLPMMLPLMSCIFLLPQCVQSFRNSKWTLAARILTFGIYLAQQIINLIKIAPRF